MKIVPILIMLLFCFGLSAKSQPYKVVDSLVRTYHEKIRSADDLYKVVYFIRKNFASDSMRLRAAFIWITNTIGYDTEAFQKENYSAGNVSYVIKHKKTICGGYASLVKYFCDAFAIECIVVDGYARNSKRSIVLNQAMLRSNHAWNAVKVNNEWRLLDATWAAGMVNDTDEEKLEFIKSYTDVYYFMPPEKFILNHLPRQSKHQLLLKNVHENEFKSKPLFTTFYLKDSITNVWPDTALIKGKRGDTLVFRLRTTAKNGQVCAWSDVLEKAAHAGFAIRKNDWVEYHYPVNATGFYNLYIGYCDNRIMQPLLAYELEIKQ